MKFAHLTAAAIAALAMLGCSNIERSRSLADPMTPAKTIAEQVCSICHGLDGNSVSPNFPRLAGQQSVYLIAQLTEFRGHNRLDPAGFEYMWGISRSLTDEQIKGLAAYYSAQTPHPSGHTDPTLATEGKTIFEQGVAEKNIPPCSACHGDHAQGNDKFPRLAYQHADYLRKQLMVFQRTDERPEGSIMKTVAHEMTPQHMQAVAAYLEAFPAP